VRFRRYLAVVTASGHSFSSNLESPSREVALSAITPLALSGPPF
jgi:hypothetical protein